MLAVFPADFGLAMLINPITVKQLIDGRIHMTLNKVIPKGRVNTELLQILGKFEETNKPSSKKHQ